jgi:hypothetical protein
MFVCVRFTVSCRRLLEYKPKFTEKEAIDDVNQWLKSMDVVNQPMYGSEVKTA